MAIVKNLSMEYIPLGVSKSKLSINRKEKKKRKKGKKGRKEIAIIYRDWR